jgi:cytochrome c oxidase accessory protein FixG
MSERGRTEDFREHLGNVTDDGKRIWLYPKIIKGKLYRYREWVSYGLLLFLFAAPFVRMGGKPFLLFNFIERHFVIFGKPFWPQDFYVLAFALITLVVFIVLFTVIFGRVWCGWTCPQTIFMELVFRRIENLIEGNSNKQKKLDAMPWNREKILKKGLKHFIFFFISFLIANTFLAYIIGSDELIKIITEPVSEHLVGLVSLLIFTTVFYLVFAKLRELVCIMICPYGRLQGVMLDRNSVVVAYDNVRGEPRGKIRKGEDQSTKGDCVDCNLCVDVCPTGIDIRNGTQLECVNCTMCIDACNSVMNKINKPEGLIRFDSVNNIESGIGFKWSPRIIAYCSVLLVLLGVFIAALLSRTDIEAVLTRAPGSMPSVGTDGMVTNVFKLELVNKTFKDIEFDIKVINRNYAQLILPEGDHMIDGGKVEEKVVLIRMPQDSIKSNRTTLALDVSIDNKKLKTIETSFLSPLKTAQ